MKNHSKIGKRVLAIALSLFMLLSAFPQSVLAAEAEEYAVTKDLNQLLVSAEFKNVDKDSEGNYSIKAGESYTIALSFRENSSLEYDMTDYVYFKLPAGIVANGASGTTNVGVRTAEGLMPIDHDYEIKDNTLYVYWNKDDAYFADLAIAHAVTFNFELTATFDGTTGEVKFNDSNETKVLIDNTGSITITKNVSGLEASLMTEEKKKEMKFELVKVTDGDTPTEEVVKSFTYFEMENGFIKFENMEPGKYMVRETNHPEFTNYTFDRGTDSTLSASGELAIVGSLNLALKNDYDYDRGTLEIGKTFEWKNWKGEVIDMPAGMKDKVSFRVTGPDFNQTYTYANFVDGKLTIKNLKVGIYTITEINNVTGYTWTYSVNNAAADKAETTATVTKDAAAPVSFQNYYKQQTGSLTIKKVGKGAEVPADTVFEVSGPIDKPVTFKYSDMKEVNGEKVYTLTDIPVGTYTVTESKDSAEVASYSLDVTGNGTVSVDVTAGAQAETTITNTYSELGSLKIIKTIAGDLTVDTLTPAQKANIKFTVYNSAGKPVGSLTYAQILDGKDTIEGLPVGKYKVVETGAQISGYTLVYSGDAENLDVVFNDTAKAEFTNTYTKDVFELTITKELVKEGSFVAELKDLPDSILTGTTYAVKDSKGKTVKVNVGGTEKSSFTLKELLAAGGKVTVTGTNAGPYKITETNPTVVGVGITTTVAVTNAKAVTENKGTSVKVELENGKTAAVTFSNKYEAQGLIKGDKKIEGLYAHEADKVKANIRFTIYKVEAGVISEYKDNVTLAQLTAGIVVPAGTYFVREVAGAGVIGYDLITNTQVEEETIKVDEATERFVVPQAGTVNIKFTNIYTRGTEGGGELVLNKYVQGLDEIKSLDPELLDEKSIYENGNGQKLYDVITFILEEKVQVNGQDTWLKYGTYSLKQFTDGEVKLPAGTFRITEENGDVKGYLLHVDYLIKSGTSAADQTSSKSMEFTIDQGTTIDMKVTNVYSHIGSLTITKTVEGKTLTATEKKNIKFTVTGPFDFKKEFTYNDMVGGVMTFSDIPVGTYYVTESGATIANYTLAVSSTGLTEGTPVSGQNLTGSVEVVSEGSSVGIKNSYSRDKGTLVIKKVMEGEAPTDMTREQMHCMKFEVRTNNQSNDSTPLYTIYYDQFTDGTYTIENVNTGTYKVSEIIDGVLTNDYTISVSDSGKGNVSATVTKGGTSTITVTNTFIKTGSLKIVKEFEGAELTSAEKASVKFVITGPNNYERTAYYSEFAWNNGILIINNLPLGEYTVTEQNDTTGYKRTTQVKVEGGEYADGTEVKAAVSFGKTSTVYFKNTYEGVAKLVIKKTVTGISGNLSDGQKKAIRFTVTNDKGTPVASFSLDNMSLGRDGVYSYTIENLVPGQYKVEETVDDELFKDYTRKTTYKVEVAAAAEGTKAAFQAKHGSTTVTFTNAYTEIAPLEVIKTGSKSYVGFVTIDGLKYPVWRFTLEISNLNPLTTKNGTTTFTDMFDAQKADWFRLATEEEVKAMAPQDTTYGANAYVLLSKDGKPAPTAAFNADCSITITGITAETAEKCEYTYYLIVKDADALEELNKPQTPGSAEVKHSFTNVVTYHPLPHKTDTKKTEYGYEYKFVALDKQLTNLGDDGQLYKEYNGKKIVVDRAAYSVTLNPQGISIGDEATITAVDTFSENQIVLLSSIKVTPGAGVTYKLDNASHTLTFTIPNGTPVTISYEATIVGSGIVTLRNDIELKGFTKSTGGDAKQEMGGSGEGTIYSVKLIKTDVNDNSKRLEGAEFGLYDGVTGNLLTTVTTNELGEVTIKEWKDNDKSFRVDHNYYLAELTAPDGYYLPQKGTEIWFRFSSDPTKVGTTVTEGGYPILLLVNGGEIIVNNTPITVNLEVTKSFDRWDLQNSFSFVLEADADEPLPADGNTKVTVTKEDPTAAFGQIHLAEGFGTYRYIIREVVDPADVVPGIVYDLSEHYVTVTVADNDDDGIAEVYVAYENSDDLVIVNRYETVDIEGTKVWNDDADRDGIRPESITIRLYADGEEIDSVEVTEQDDWSFSFTDLIRYSDNGVTPIVYTISEDEVEGYTTLITGNAAAGFTVTNTHDIDTIEVKGIKVWDDANNGNLTRPESISINLLADGVKVASITVTQADNWTFSFTDLPRCSADGKAIVYTITEDAVENYTTVITGNAADGFVVTNTNIPELPHTPGDPPLPPTGPNTGDNSNAGLWMALMMLASLAAGAAFVARKKREA